MSSSNQPPNGPPSAFVPFMFGPPAAAQPAYYGNNSRPFVHPNEAPARVEKAMDFIYLISQKTQPRAAVNDISIEVIDGQKLSTAENVALAAACHCLSAYFAGKLRMTPMEALHMDLSADELRDDDGPAGAVAGPGGGEVSLCVHCVMCNPAQPDPACLWCKGCGKVMVTPLRGAESSSAD